MSPWLNTISIAGAGRILLITIALVGVGAAFLSLSINHQVTEVESVWQRFDAQRSEKVRALNALYAELGYGGMIHHLKNLLLRGNTADATQAELHLGGARGALRRYLAQDLSDREQAAIAIIKDTLDAYAVAIERAGKQIEAGRPTQQIDAAIRVDDQPALASLADLGDAARHSTTQCAENCKPWLLEDLNRVLGYGGMIHAFKNYILRGDRGYLIRAREKLRMAEQLLDRYQFQTLSDGEREQLVVIQGTLQRYRRSFTAAEKMQAKQVVPQEIDTAVQVDDQPALQAMALLVHEHVAEGERDATRVYTALNVTRTLSLVTLLTALSMMFLLVLIAWWLIRRRIVRPIQRITETMGRLSNGEMHINIPETSQGNEIGRMAAALQVFKDNTQAYLHAKSEMQAILDNAADSIIVIDQRGIMQNVNLAACAMFEYTTQELIGQNVNILMPRQHRVAHDGYIHRYLGGGAPKSIGFTREWEGQRCSGATFPMELRVSEVLYEEERLFIGIIRDITERKRLERMKSEFVSTVSHELRTPLTSIIGSLGLLRGGAAGALPERAGQMLDIAQNNAERLVRLINDILDTEKIESGRMEYRMQRLNLCQLIDQAVAENRGYGERHEVRLSWPGSELELEVQGDLDRLLQVMANLISNAVKYSPKGGQIELELASEADQATVRVTDHGPGIPEEFQTQMFKKFSQADSSDTRQKAGTGLGLVISKAIVEHHGGSIGFKTAQGEGTCFHLRLPLLAQEKTQLTAKTAVQGRVLVCEDDRDIATLLQIILRQGGLESDVALNAAEAKQLLANNDYLAMTLDLVLPGQDGIALLRELREAAATRDLPVVVVSARAEEGRRELNGGAINILDWIPKPIDEKRLLSDLQRLLRNDDRPSILHVEDDPDVASVVAAVVGEKANIQVVTRVAEAREELDRHDYQLVILDLTLPDGSGEELLPLMHDRSDKPIPVIVFSARDLQEGAGKLVNQALLKSLTSNEQLLETIMSQIDGGQTTP
ncbi:MAG: ATP-binding protein [Gammaproteobacteria bacterium]|nr:ATP-binding protein [Gammaproteobacteria bacterium]